jgi:hypothetical protein
MTYFYPQGEHDRQIAALTRRLVLLRRAVEKSVGHYTHQNFRTFLQLVAAREELKDSHPQAV